MQTAKNDIIARLEREILPLSGFKSLTNGSDVDVGLGPIRFNFPNAHFPLAAIHEFCCSTQEDSAATAGFISGIVASLMKKEGASIWISATRNVFPPSLRLFGIDPEKVIFIHPQNTKDILWAIEEALKCEGLAAVVGEVKDVSFTVSRRLQLAVEQSRITGFIIRTNACSLNITASISRWKITSIPSQLPEGMPGVGFPRWNVELLKVRNGKPGRWELEWRGGRFRHTSRLSILSAEERRRTG